MKERSLFVTEFDIDRLRALLKGTRLWSTTDREYLQHLEEELDRANVVAPKDVPGDVITMNSRLRVRDVDSGRDLTLTIVFPSDADLEQGKISIVAPIGTAPRLPGRGHGGMAGAGGREAPENRGDPVPAGGSGALPPLISSRTASPPRAILCSRSTNPCIQACRSAATRVPPP